MLTDAKIAGKIAQLEQRYAALRFAPVATLTVEMTETREHFRQVPGPDAGLSWGPVAAGTTWGGEWLTGWFRSTFECPAELADRALFVRAHTGGETLFWVDGCTHGVFDDNHPVVCLTGRAEAGRVYVLAWEAYAGHFIPGCMPHDHPARPQGKHRTFGGIEIVTEREDVTAFVFDLRVLRQVVKVLDEHSLRRHTLVRELAKVYAAVPALPDEQPEAVWRPALAAACDLMQPLLACHNGPTVPQFGIIGHSHIDTAWLWPLTETWRKCARTFSSVLNLMEQYPEFQFIQSQPCQTAVLRTEYPELFARVQEAVAAGRWEPNGGMWVEPDCNIPSGESFVRQLLYGQQATREFFGYAADTLWLPDVFGYSAALPQILRGCGIEFFCTTKISWNDTTRFPYDTFYWRGIDGTTVLAHYNAIHCWPDPEALTQQWHWVQHKDTQDRRLCAFGFGDGGGGPQAEMLEVARRLGDLEGCPRTQWTTVSQFMRSLRDELPALPVWSGELYLELHRGTLTSISEIKRGNRHSELALRDAEFLGTLVALAGGAYPAAQLSELWREVLTNQFHDILPGSSIAEVNDVAVASFQRCIAAARELSQAALRQLAPAPAAAPPAVLVANSLSWDRPGELVLTGVPPGLLPAAPGVIGQWIADFAGNLRLVVSGLHLPALGTVVLPLHPGQAHAREPFRVAQDVVETPHARLRFDERGAICSWWDKTSDRELVKAGEALNVFLLGEDVPEAWDNWDIDRDQRLKMRPVEGFVRRTVVACGALQLRLRSEYRLSPHSTLVQDLVAHADSPQLDFKTLVTWGEKHQLLKVRFPLAIVTDVARHEIQYGHVERPTHTNLPQDRARFEVCAHKWTDLSDNGFGVALLNDGKYGIGVHDSTLSLSLLKSGTHPDARGDAGPHQFTYALLPHAGPFSVPAVVRPAYELNVPVTTVPVAADAVGAVGLLTLDAPNVIVEAVKLAERGDGLIVRLYEAGKASGPATVRFGVPVRTVSETNLLEDDPQPLPLSDGAVTLFFQPFQIRTLHVTW